MVGTNSSPKQKSSSSIGSGREADDRIDRVDVDPDERVDRFDVTAVAVLVAGVVELAVALIAITSGGDFLVPWIDAAKDVLRCLCAEMILAGTAFFLGV